ncbi:MAG: DNA polymerase IV [Gammaproteobacteria bacterium]
MSILEKSVTQDDTLPVKPAKICLPIWPSAILHVDMNAFFASVEQRDFPELRGRPVAVTNGEQGTTIITCSYEARAFGVHTGMHLREARLLCPGIVQRPARPQVYAAISTAIMLALHDVSPDVEVFSVDEAFLDLTHCQSLHGSPERMGHMVQAKVQAASGLPCSIGISGNKAMAKFAANLVKPNGFTVIPPGEARARLEHEPATALSGIAAGIGGFLAARGAVTCGDVGRLPVSVLAERLGNLGRHIWLMCRGEDPAKVQLDVAAPKTLGHGKVVPPGTRERDVLLTYFLHMSEKVGARLRRHELQAQHFFIGLRVADGWLGHKPRLAEPSSDGKAIYQLCRAMMENNWHGEPVSQVQVTALDPQAHGLQLGLFTSPDKAEVLNGIVDKINRRYGEFTVAPARLLGRSVMPNVIAPAWKPTGHRQSV